jgi:chromosome segregation ATPase
VSTASTERLLGELVGEVRGLRLDVEALKDAHRNNAAKRSMLHEILENVKTEVVLIKKEIEDTRPDIQRCRMLRHWGIVSVGFIGLGASVFGLWEHIKRIFQ